MEQNFQDGKTYDKGNFREGPLKKGEYENCTFSNCDFSGTDLSEIEFIECHFISCNLSLVKLANSVFRDVKFIGCKMLGFRFDTCAEFGLSFIIENCSLNHSIFFKTKVRGTTFRNSMLHEIDFTECDLTSAIFNNCDLMGSKFENTIIEKADFRTSYNYSIDPENNRIKRAKFSIPEVVGLLNKYGIIIDKTI